MYTTGDVEGAARTFLELLELAHAWPEDGNGQTQSYLDDFRVAFEVCL